MLLTAQQKSTVRKTLADKRRAELGTMSPTELRDRCMSAARIALTGKRFSTEDRVEVAAEIIAQGIAREVKLAGPGAMPRRDDGAHSLKAYRRRADEQREKLLAKRAGVEPDESADGEPVEVADNAAPVETLVLGHEPLIRGGAASQAQAHAIAADAIDTLQLNGAPCADNVRTLIYWCARDLGETVVAAELGITKTNLAQRIRRAKSALATRYPSMPELAAALTGGGSPIIATRVVLRTDDAGRATRVEPIEPELRFTIDGRTSVPHGVRHAQDTSPTKVLAHKARQWRTGTNVGACMGEHVARPETEDAANARCTVRKVNDRNLVRRARRRAAKLTAEDRLDAKAQALTNLTHALTAASKSTLTPS